MKSQQKHDKAMKNPGGRPRKFREPSRPITVTLPESVLRQLNSIDPDRAQAIAKVTRAAVRADKNNTGLVEIVEMMSNTGLIVIGPSQALRQIPFLHLVEVAPARYLLALDPGNDFKSLELAINDVMEDLPDDESHERELIALLIAHIRRLRKSNRVTMAEILFVNLK